MSLTTGQVLTRSTARIDVTSERTANPTKWWAWLGAAFVALQVIVYGGWIVSGDARPTVADQSTIPTWVKASVWFYQLASPILFVIFVRYVWRRSRREGKICFDALVVLAWMTIFWQDPGGIFLRTQTLYNSYFVNLGSWAPHIPGWISPNANRLPEPLLMSGFAYATSGLGSMMLVTAAMRWAKARRPQTGKVGLVGVALLSGAVIDLLLETLLIRTHMLWYTGAVQWLSLFPGSVYQFPLYEPLLWGAGVWGALGAVRYFRDDRGRSIVERGADRLSVSEWHRTAVRALALCGLFNVAYLIYNIMFAGLSLYGGPTPVDKIPDYMRNGMCGPGTGYHCPAPSIAIPLRDTPPDR